MRSLTFLSFLLVANLAWASPVKFDFYEAKHGLSMNTVTDIATDDAGYLWVATQDGLNRFDGEQFKIYRVTGDNRGPTEKHIKKLFFGRKKQLWLLTKSDGLNLYQASTDTFKSYNSENTLLPKAMYTDIGQDGQGNLWLATNSIGLIRYSPASNEIIKHYRQASDQLNSNHVKQVFVDKFDRLWLITDKGLSQINSKGEVIDYPNIQSKIMDSITSLEVGHSNTLWIGTKSKGLYLFDIYTGSLKEITSASSLRGRKITNIQQGRFGKLWLGVESVGLARYSPQNKTIQYFISDPDKAYSLSSPIVTALSLDSENQLWIGTQGGGLNKIYLEAETFGHIHPFSFTDNNLHNGNIRSIYRDRHQQLWIGTSMGLYRAQENKHKKITGFELFEVPGSRLSQSFISFIIEDKQDRFWVGTRGEGLFIFTADKQSYVHYKHEPNNPNGLPSDLVLSIYFDHQDNAWLTTRNAGVAKYIDEEHGFTQYKHKRDDANSIASNEVNAVIQDKANNYWFASYTAGLSKLSPEGKFTHFSTDTESPIPNRHLLALFESDTGLLWLGSTEGVFSFDPITYESQVFNMDNGLIGDTAYLTILDKQQRLWIGTSSGLSQLNTQNFNIKNYTIIDGLQDNEFNYGAGFIDDDNRVYLGGINGFNYFFASQLPKLPAPRKPVINRLSVRSSTDPARIQHSPIAQETKLTLTYEDDLFTFHFHSPELHRATRLSYEYRMIGLHDKWLATNKDQSVHFTGLAAGAYIFLLKAKDINGQSSPVRQVNVKILPSPWRSWWAYALYSLALISIFSMTFYSRVNKFNQQARLLRDKEKSEQRLQLSLWGSGDEFWDWDVKNSKVVRTNTFLNYPSNETHLQETLKTCIHPDDLVDIKPKMDACINQGIDKFEMIYRGKMMNGHWLWVQNRGQVIDRDNLGAPTRLAGTIKNIQSQKETEAELITLNQDLEKRVLGRTLQFQQSNDELKQALEKLEFTQSELINKEKMATLGGLVASITHEINTPIGISVTAASHLQESVKVFNKKYTEGDVSHEDFEQYQNEVYEASILLLSNLDRAAKLIKSFKQVSVDQSHEDIQEFNLKVYLDEIFLALNPLLSRTGHQYSYQCPDNLMVKSRPGVFYQIISNLFNNSVVHGFPDGHSGKLTLNVIKVESGIEMIYQDNGCGMSASVQEQIFDPFFTTKRGKGGSGLGMNIVYNLVTRELEGEIRLHSELGAGCTFNISLPMSTLV
ncbi:histidine kinase [Shewanella psychropiezotolerans]|uniref:histidine kinase n=1 Tax=Shewanella psychropiezotolerans TaxID=2593655 RepID=A0ABX5X183_9GAMM|nr:MULTISPECIES: two-component regulator propeller domain-containing protein [Shewanella]MPY22680.1 histidine kinase [Shewanella sp. YLB-07]QDO83031.1 histidine kinase [Shewanella psychropiezotolerans]